MSENLDFLSFDDVASTRPTIPDGEYHIKVVEPSKEKSKDGNPYLSYSALVMSGPHMGYRIFNGVFSLKRENVWQFKRDTKAVGFQFPAGLTIPEAADFFEQNANGFELVAQIGSKVSSVKSDNGTYVPDPEGNRENTIKRWLKPVL